MEATAVAVVQMVSVLGDFRANMREMRRWTALAADAGNHGVVTLEGDGLAGARRLCFDFEGHDIPRGQREVKGLGVGARSGCADRQGRYLCYTAFRFGFGLRIRAAGRPYKLFRQFLAPDGKNCQQCDKQSYTFHIMNICCRYRNALRKRSLRLRPWAPAAA